MMLLRAPGRVLPAVVAIVVAIVSTFGLLVRPATGAPRHTVDYVLIAGAPGLRWDDVNRVDTPTLWQLAQQGTIGALSVRSAHRPTCPADGWVTLGAGNYAQRTAGPTPAECPRLDVLLERPDNIGAHLPDQRAVVLHNREKLPWGAVPGALAESVRCTTAVGPGAAVAAARPFGRVDRYLPALPADPEQARAALGACRLGIVDLGTVAGERPAARRSAARQADQILARLLAARPDSSLLIVAGLSDTGQTSRLHVAVADGPGWAGGWLSSASTGRPGYVSLVDLAPTALAALGESLPQQLFAGHRSDRTADRPADLAAAVTRLSDADREAGAQRSVAGRFFAILAVAQMLLYLAAVPLLRRARRYGGPHAKPPWPPAVRRTGEILLVAAALAIPAALLTDGVPWWRSGRPGVVFVAVSLATLAFATAGIMLGPLRNRTIGPLLGVSAVAAAVVGVDLLTGARLQLNGVAGYSALEGGRYAGVGTVGLGTFVAGLLLVAGCFAQRVPRRWRPTLVAAVGGIGVLLVGSPYLGADAGGAVALTAGVCIAAALSTGGWLTFIRLAWATLAGLAVTTGFALLDLRRPVEERGSLGRFLTQLSDGTGGPVVHRTGAANVVAFATSPLTMLAIAAALFLWFALLRDWGGLKRLFGLYPAVRAGFAGVAVASVIAGLFNEAALNVAGAAAATVLPLAVLAALRVLRHADDRTVVAEPRRSEPEPAVRADHGAAGDPDGAGKPSGAGDPDGAGKPSGAGDPDGAGKPDGAGDPDRAGEPSGTPGGGAPDAPGERESRAGVGDVLP